MGHGCWHVATRTTHKFPANIKKCVVSHEPIMGLGPFFVGSYHTVTLQNEFPIGLSIRPYNLVLMHR